MDNEVWTYVCKKCKKVEDWLLRIIIIMDYLALLLIVVVLLIHLLPSETLIWLIDGAFVGINLS